MPDPATTGGPLGFFFPSLFGNVPAAQSYEALQARRKIAEAMMARQTKYPKNVGEGLSAIGEAIGDRGYYNSVMADEAASKGYEGSTLSKPAPAPSTYVPYSPTPAPATPPATQKTSEAAPDDTGAPVASAQVNGDPWAGRSNAIAGIESGGAKNPYSLMGAATRTGDRAIGKYQVMGANVPEWTQAALGQPMTAEQFRNSPDAQEAVFKHRFGQYVNKYGEEGAARAWFGGEGGMKNPNATDVHGRLTVAGYGQDYLKRLGGAPQGPRDQVAAAMTPPPPTVAAAAAVPDSDPQEARLNDVVGMQKAPTSGYAFPPTANARTGDVQSDASPLGIRPTGGLGGDSPAAASVADTVQARGNAIQGPIPITPEPNPPPAPGQIQTADATAPRPPGVTTDATAAAPVTAPPVPPLGPKPAPPQLMPTENDRTRYYESIAADPRLPPTARANAKEMAQVERSQISAFNAQKIQEYNEYLRPWIAAEQKLKDPASVYATEKAKRDLEGEGATPLTPQQREQYGIAPGQAAYMTRRGEIKFGPAGTNVTVDQRGENEFAKKNADALSKTFSSMTEDSVTASDDLDAITALRKSGVQSGGYSNVVKFLSDYGIKLEGAGPVEYYSAMIDRMVPRQRVPGSGTTSDFDARGFKSSLPGLMKTPEGNELIMSTMEAMAENKMKRGDIAFRVQSGELSPTDGVKALRQLQVEAKGRSEAVKTFADEQRKKADALNPNVIPDDLPKGAPIDQIVKDENGVYYINKPSGWQKLKGK